MYWYSVILFFSFSQIYSQASWSEIDVGMTGSQRGEDVYFTSENHGVIVGYETIFKTVDSGLSWDKSLYQESLSAVFFTDNNNGVAVGGGNNKYKIIKTTDGGSTWVTVGLTTYNPLYDVYFLDSKTGWAVASGYILKTTDGGSTWSYELSNVSGDPRSVYFINNNFGWISTQNGMLYRTLDGGSTWSKILDANLLNSSSDDAINAVFFINENTGWASGVGIVLYTVDGGSTWSVQSIGTNKTLYDIVFLDSNNGWTVGQDGIFKTSDGGSSWFLESISSSIDYGCCLYGIFALSNENLWVVGGNKTVLHYRDITAPTVISISSTIDDDTYGIGSIIPITITFSESVIVTGAPQLTLETGDEDAVIDYTSGSGSTDLVFNYTVASGHTSSDLDYTSSSSLIISGGTIKDATGNEAIINFK